MTAIHAVMLVPAEGDPHGLLADGPCGARPPMAHMRPRPPGTTGAVEWGAGEKGYATPHALVLKWKGKPARLGMLWAGWLLEEQGWTPLESEPEPHEFLHWRAFDLTPEALARFCEEAGLGTVVLLGADGREIKA